MKKVQKEPAVPMERHDTIRKYIVALLEEHTLTSKEISAIVRISEKDVYDHLEHIRRTMNKGNKHLVVRPAQCEQCGFTFVKRGRLSKPGKCPVCRNGLILPPLFSVVLDRERSPHS
jgi:predicted Zn-ribbon and HTH transcriptional regulator